MNHVTSSSVFDHILALSESYATRLQQVMDTRDAEMDADDNSHYLIYRVLGVTDREGDLIDRYQNKGRFLYKYAGSFLEDAATMCFEHRYPDAVGKTRIPNTQGVRPKTFEIDFLINDRAYEIKWRDATTDGDHITKEHTRALTIQEAGFIPVRVMFYYPNRQQAIRIQRTLETLYKGMGGEYYYGDSAWEHVESFTGVDLLGILQRIAEMKTGE